MTMLGQIDDATFESRVLRAERPVLVGFLNPKLADPKPFEAELEAVAKAQDERLDVGWVDLSTAKPKIEQWLARLGLGRANRTYLVFRDGEVWTRCFGRPSSAKLIVDRTIAALGGDQAALAGPLASLPAIDDASFEAEFTARPVILAIYNLTIPDEIAILALAKTVRGVIERHADAVPIRLVDIDADPHIAERFAADAGPLPRYVAVARGVEVASRSGLMVPLDDLVGLLQAEATPAIGRAAVVERPRLDEALVRSEARALLELLVERLPEARDARASVELPAKPRPSALMRAFWSELGWHPSFASLELAPPDNPDSEAMVRARLREYRSPEFRVTRKQLPKQLRLVAYDDDGIGFVVTDESGGADDPPLRIVLYDSGEVIAAKASYLEWCANALVRRAFRGPRQPVRAEGLPSVDIPLAGEPLAVLESPLPRLSPVTARVAEGVWRIPTSADDLEPDASRARIAAASSEALERGLAELRTRGQTLK